ncbi:MAG: Fe-S protein assembly co-chaperone HscB [Bacteroidia bacterium]|nr:Fe-S protein assembly co-chaperone HscB [Bacteroidia bacterium]MDW8346352.1 Fe-S protein assembly co-chaperone HscB [Bacteroidia bacterium]
MNYFEFYQIPESFFIDETELRKKYHQITKQLHPDFYTTASQIEQQLAIEKSTLNNQAYKTLSNLDSRIEYILHIHGLLENIPPLPQDFLMKMMDINEAVEEGKKNEVKENILTIKKQLWQEIEPILKNYPKSENPKTDLEKVRLYYLKNKYLDRLLEK